MSYAVVLAGISGRIINNVLSELRRIYSDGSYIFRGAGATVNADKQANYDGTTIRDALRLGADAVFGRSERPYSFCRGDHSHCKTTQPDNGRRTRFPCRANYEETCGLKKPQSLILVYQEGYRESALLEKFHHSAFVIRLGSDVYDKRDRTVERIREFLSRVKPMLASLRDAMSSRNSPLLLPPLNFREPLIEALFSACQGGDWRRLASRVRSEFWKRSERAFVGARLKFEPTELGEDHGLVGPLDEPALALSRQYRFGCEYAVGLRGFHYDVRRSGGQNFDGSVEIVCRKRGAMHPKSAYVNLLVDDCIR